MPVYRFKVRSKTPGASALIQAALSTVAGYPAASNVKLAIGYGVSGTNFTGTYGGGGGIATPTLAVVDQGDGTGATATIAAGESDAANTVYTRVESTAAWIASGTCVGNSTVDLALACGWYWAYCQSVSAGVTVYSTPVRFQVSAGTDSTFEQCFDAVWARVKAQSLTGITTANIVQQKFPWTGQLNKPGIVVCPFADKVPGGTNEADDVEYNCLVAWARVSNRNLTDGLETVLKWREQISQAFRSKSIVATMGVAKLYNVRVEPAAVFWEPAFANQHDVGALNIVCVCREIKGA